MTGFTGSVSGNIFIHGKMRQGTLIIGRETRFIPGQEGESDIKGTLIPAFVNAHTHIGDSFIREIPRGTIPEIVGPGGFKHRMLQQATDDQIIAGMRWAMQLMEETGTFAFIDFRESGLRGIRLLEAASSGEVIPVVLGRSALNGEDLEAVIGEAHGFGPSAINDVPLDEIKRMRDLSRRDGKILAIHFSENVRESITDLMDIHPDIAVHCIEATDDDLRLLKEAGIPVVITPRSNIFYGKRPDYGRIVKSGSTVMLGTDNGMVSPPDMFREMSFLYLYQHGTSYIDPDAILTMATENPISFLKRFGALGNESYILYPDRYLSSYEIVTKGRYFPHRMLKTG